MNLENIIEALKTVPPETEITFDDGYIPTRFDSWRGVYEELALEFQGSGVCFAGELLQAAESCVGATFKGYKGGEFKMSLATPVCRDNYGEFTCIGIMTFDAESGQFTTAALNDYR